MIQENEWIREATAAIKEKMDWLSEKSKDKIPYTTIDGEHDNRADTTIIFNLDDGLNWWTNGFWGGMLWLMYHETDDKKYAQIARYNEELLDKCFEDFYGLHHDVGFMWLPTAVANYRLTKNEDAKRRAMHAATILAGRFNPVGKFIRAWNDLEDETKDTRGWAIIDCLFNIPLLYWASEESNDPRFKQIAMMHADTAMNTFVRADGSVRHIVEFDPFTGEFVTDHGGQGYAKGSSWTRGQTWGLYGFVISYMHTGKQEYLDTAKKIAHYFIANIPEDGIIPVDFRQPKEPAWEDSCAAAIAACGLIEISRVVDECERELYLQPAIKLLKTLYEKRSDFSKDNDNILTNCTAAYHDKKHHFSIIYGDYYFMEAMFRLNGNDIFLW
ncbi:glycoside hydrolase family 88 protein [Anaerosporobacter sp.]|uniref:glycoside hydrolase family 88 protein n=1 Tax=Anaerosporobacter sp. TaxID=1872529 RepID=UPI00286F899C|nr:glycoside hydrolase family 88 protein [Anaerosporobacter sp.]